MTSEEPEVHELVSYGEIARVVELLPRSERR